MNKAQRPKLVLIQGGKKDNNSNPWAYAVLVFIALSLLLTLLI